MTVIGKANSRKIKNATVGYWHVRCGCGKEREIQAAHLLRRNKGPICGRGCGFISTNLTEVSCSVCSKKYTVQIRSLKIKRQRVCKTCMASRALNSVRGKPAHNRLPDAEGPFKGLYTRYRFSAAERGFEFNLSLDEFRVLTKGDCHFCGAPPSQLTTKWGKGSAPMYVYNGVDRVDSRLGYMMSNAVPCCGICNRMKGDIPVDSFLEKIALIYKRHGAKSSV